MQCPEVHQLFTDLADNTLARKELDALTDHLLDCPACTLEWREFQQTLSLVHNLEAQTPPVDLLPAIQARLPRRKGVFDRVWDLVETLNFSLSLPVAAAVFSMAMLAAFLLKTLPPAQTGFFLADSVRSSSPDQGELLAISRPPVASSLMFAVSHTGWPQNSYPGSLVRTDLAPHSSAPGNTHRLLSPDIHVLIENITRDSRIALCQEILHRNWQLHHLTGSLFLVHLPQTELGDFHELLARHHFVLVPAAATKTRFGDNKKILTAALRFQ
ncbi:MAG: hypothetical protein A2505_09340 [Deltaproteobacteria bacterium RIFOXYD12_FULL_55_16]|nr:MAG: hypothetical protein A2505_09340 [Deltaproteobacteria bacterium RIFOXYD12_FULL_55_16]